MTQLITSILRLACELALLAVIAFLGIRDLSWLACLLIMLRLLVSHISRMIQLPNVFSDKFNRILSRVIICISKIALEVGIFFSLKLKGGINISTEIVITILLLMVFRNISDTWSLLATELEE